MQLVNKSRELILASISIMAAMAWKDVTKALFDKVLVFSTDSLHGKIFYAIIMTTVVIYVMALVDKLNKKDEGFCGEGTCGV